MNSVHEPGSKGASKTSPSRKPSRKTKLGAQAPSWHAQVRTGTPRCALAPCRRQLWPYRGCGPQPCRRAQRRVAARLWPYRGRVPRASTTVSWALLCAVSQETLAACPLPSHNTPWCITIHLLPPQATALAAVSRYNFFVSRHSPSAY